MRQLSEHGGTFLESRTAVWRGLLLPSSGPYCLAAVAWVTTGEREVLGVDVGPAEDYQFWLGFLRDLKERGVAGVLLVTSDAHLGLKAAVAQVFTGATWQSCRVHYADLRIMPTTGLPRTRLVLKRSA